MGTLDDLYGHLGSALEAEERLTAADDATLQQIEQRQGELQRARAEAEGDERQLQAIDSELRELDQAYRTITERRADDASPEPDSQPPAGGQRGGRGDDPGEG